MQKALAEDAFYAIEFLCPTFEKLSKDDQVKTIIHELMHIPQAFGGGFRHHDFVTDRAVNKKYKEYQTLLKDNENKENKIEDW